MVDFTLYTLLVHPIRHIFNGICFSGSRSRACICTLWAANIHSTASSSVAIVYIRVFIRTLTQKHTELQKYSQNVWHTLHTDILFDFKKQLNKQLNEQLMTVIFEWLCISTGNGRKWKWLFKYWVFGIIWKN